MLLPSKKGRKIPEPTSKTVKDFNNAQPIKLVILDPVGNSSICNDHT